MKAKNAPQEEKAATKRKAASRMTGSILAGYLEELSVGKMDHDSTGFPFDRDNLYLGTIGLIVHDLDLLVLLGVRSINGNRYLLGPVIQIGTETRILEGITFRSMTTTCQIVFHNVN
jgi:hypothetical protein